MNNFQKRVLSAIVIVSVTLFGLFMSPMSFKILFFIITLGCWWEYMQLTLEDAASRRVLGVVLCSVIYWTWPNLPDSYPAISVLFFTTLIIILLILEVFLQSDHPFKNVAFFVLGVFYIILPFTMLNDLTVDHFQGRNTFSPRLVAGIISLTWIYDTSAYLIGTRFGQNLLIPGVSPKKTWEGTIGGAGVCILASLLVAPLAKTYTTLDWFIIGIIVSVAGLLGDLVESLFKRSVGVKDSGMILPGHGGFLDRFDSFVVIIPFVYLFLVIKSAYN
jgi:phosphatidate cytidylyltransferase